LDACRRLCWRVGQVADVLGCVDKAEQQGPVETEESVSWWRMRNVSVGQFLDDCGLARRMFQGGPLRPTFLGPPVQGVREAGPVDGFMGALSLEKRAEGN